MKTGSEDEKQVDLDTGKNRKRICCLGDVRCDVVIPYGEQLKYEQALRNGMTEGLKKPFIYRKSGGTTGNTTNILGKLGADVSFSGLVWKGEEGDWLLDIMRSNHVKLTNVVRGDQKFIVYAVVDANGERTFMFPEDDDSAYGDFTGFEFPGSFTDSFDILYICGANIGGPETQPQVDYALKCKNLGKKIVMDLNLRFTDSGECEGQVERIRQAALASDILLGSGTDEFGPIFGYEDLDTAGRELSKDGRIVILRDGKNAPILARDGKLTRVQFEEVEPISTDRKSVV